MAQAVLRPGSLSDSDSSTLLVGGDFVSAIDPGPNLAHDDAGSYIGRVGSVGTFYAVYNVLPTTIPSLIASITQITAFWRSMRATDGGGGTSAVQAAGRIQLGGNTVDAANQNVAADAVWKNYSAILSRPGGGSWSASDLVAATFHFGVVYSVSDGSDINHTSLWLLVDYTPGGQGIEEQRRVASARLRVRRLPGGLIGIEISGPEYLDRELGEIFCISHPDLPGAALTGAGVKVGDRWPVMLRQSSINKSTLVHSLVVQDMREILTTWWSTGKTPKAPIVYADGIARLDAGNSRTWLRSSSALVQTPNDTLVSISFDTDHIDKDGELFQGARTNEIIQSGFKNGTFTGWSTSGTGSNGSAIAADTTDLLFDNAADTTLPGQSAKITAGAPVHAADMYVQSTATASILANTICRASFWHKDDSGQAPYYALQRGVDSNWWKESDQSWNASIQWNPMTVSTKRARYKTKQINVGASNTTLTLRIGQPTASAVAAQINHLYHVQLEQGRFVTSAILTEGAIATRQADRLTISNPSNAPCMPPDRATSRFYVKTLWDAADVPTSNKTIFYVEHDANNKEWLYYDGANTRWAYEVTVAGAMVRAAKSDSPVTGPQKKIVTRRCSSFGEQGLAAFTISVFVDGVRGTDAVAAGSPAIATAGFTDFGNRLASDQFDGNIYNDDITQQALSDAQIGRF